MAESFLRFNLQEIVTIVPVAVGNRCPGRLTLNHQFLDACGDHQDMTSLLLNNMFLFRILLYTFSTVATRWGTPQKLAIHRPTFSTPMVDLNSHQNVRSVFANLVLGEVNLGSWRKTSNKITAQETLHDSKQHISIRRSSSRIY